MQEDSDEKSTEQENASDPLQPIAHVQTHDLVQPILGLIDPVMVFSRIGQDIGQDSRSRYSHVTHASLCRFRMLGLSNVAAAQAIGITPTTLNEWRRKHPMLEADLQQAAQIMNAAVAGLLLKMMEGNSPTAFNAVRFYLTTHAEEFRERAELEVKPADSRADLERAIRSIYGLDIRLTDDEPLSLPAGACAEPETVQQLPLGPADWQDHDVNPAPGNPRDQTQTTPVDDVSRGRPERGADRKGDSPPAGDADSL
jgi:hypothetical protein